MRLLSDTFAFLKKVTIHCHYMDEFKQDIFFHFIILSSEKKRTAKPG